MQWVQIQPSYVLYAKPFRDTSALLEVFSRDYGRVSLIAKGVRGQQTRSGHSTKSRFQGLLSPFIPLLISWKGRRTSLFNLTTVEAWETPPYLTGQQLFYGWYLNELLSYTLKHFDAHPKLFEAYHLALHQLKWHPQKSLRQFEKMLLMSLGVLPQLDRETKTGHVVQPNQWYIFSPTEGVLKDQHYFVHNRFQGSILLAAQSNQWECTTQLAAIKRLFRLMIDHVLAGIKIRSRDLLHTHTIKEPVINNV